MVDQSNPDSFEYITGTNRFRLNDRRVSILKCLQTRENPISLFDLAATLVKQEKERSLIDGTMDDGISERIQIQLHHVDLPLLDEANLCMYDPKQRTVLRRDDPTEPQPQLSSSRQNDAL